jgi:aryl-alcohol dehydrogenase-like predicted oxidoreductase
MQYHQLGLTDLMVSQLSLGTAAFGSRTERSVAVGALRTAYEYGITLYDTAPFYGQGESERIIGETFTGHREKIVIATKVGLYPSVTLKLASKFKPIVRFLLNALEQRKVASFGSIPTQKLSAQVRAQKFPNEQILSLRRLVKSFLHENGVRRFDRQSMLRSVDASLRRLRTDYIDLLQLHFTPQASEIDEAIETLKLLKQQGKIRYYGASTQILQETLMWLQTLEYGISTLQVKLNLFETEVLEQGLPLALANQISIIGREPFAEGKLLYSNLQESQGLSFLGSSSDNEGLLRLSQQLGRPLPQIGLQFLAQTSGVSTILAGMSKASHVMNNVNALEQPPLTEEEMSLISSWASANRFLR